MDPLREPNGDIVSRCQELTGTTAVRVNEKLTKEEAVDDSEGEDKWHRVDVERQEPWKGGHRELDVDVDEVVVDHRKSCTERSAFSSGPVTA